VVSSLLFHVSVGFGYTPETLRNLTISLAPFQRATSIVEGDNMTLKQIKPHLGDPERKERVLVGGVRIFYCRGLLKEVWE